MSSCNSVAINKAASRVASLGRRALLAAMKADDTGLMLAVLNEGDQDDEEHYDSRLLVAGNDDKSGEMIFCQLTNGSPNTEAQG